RDGRPRQIVCSRRKRCRAMPALSVAPGCSVPGDVGTIANSDDREGIVDVGTNGNMPRWERLYPQGERPWPRSFAFFMRILSTGIPNHMPATTFRKSRPTQVDRRYPRPKPLISSPELS